MLFAICFFACEKSISFPLDEKEWWLLMAEDEKKLQMDGAKKGL